MLKPSERCYTPKDYELSTEPVYPQLSAVFLYTLHFSFPFYIFVFNKFLHFLFFQCSQELHSFHYMGSMPRIIDCSSHTGAHFQVHPNDKLIFLCSHESSGKRSNYTQSAFWVTIHFNLNFYNFAAVKICYDKNVGRKSR